MNIRIYQVNMKRDTNNVAFMRYELLEKLQGSQSVDSKIYDKVFDGEVDCQTLEDVYQMFNLNHPEGYKDRSLSVSDVVEETAQSFQALATQQGRQLHLSIQEMLSLEGSEKDIRQLTSILLDNALKYAPPATDITLRLEKEAKTLRLSVENAISQPMTKETLSRLFDRFYRVDSSRNSSTGGYGLGLAIASGIVTAHKGKIRAESPDGKRLVITAAFPLN